MSQPGVDDGGVRGKCRGGTGGRVGSKVVWDWGVGVGAELKNFKKELTKENLKEKLKVRAGNQHDGEWTRCQLCTHCLHRRIY